MTGTAAPIPVPYLSLLAQLIDEGGSGDLDRYGRITVGPTKSILRGTSVEWLYLVAQGAVAGERGKIIVTESGRELGARYVNGRERTSSF